MKVYFTIMIVSLLYLALLMVNYFSKKRIKSAEVKLFEKVMFITVCSLILEILSVITVSKHEQLYYYALIVNKAYIASILLYIHVLSLYLWNIFYAKNKKLTGLKKMLTSIYRVLFIIFLIGIIVLPLNFYYDGNLIYSYGAATNCCFIGAGVLITSWFLCLLVNKEHVFTKKLFPLLLFALIAGGVLFLRNSHPEITIISSTEALIVFLMYFTIENPDVKMMDELAKNKKIIEAQNEDNTNFLFRITQDIKKPIQDLLEESKNSYLDPKYVNNKMRELDFTVNDVLDVSGMSTKKIKIYDNNYDIHNLMKEIKVKTEMNLPKDIKMDYYLSSNVPKMLYGDYIMLKKIILSLIDNAIKHTTEGYISLNVDAIVKYEIARVIISVSDTGQGMDLGMINDILSHEIGDEQYSLDNEKGILNLRDIKHIMPSLDGTFVIKSENGVGTTVSITINERIVNTEEREIAKKIEMYEESLNSGKRIMLIDDNANDLSKIKKLLENKDSIVSASLFGRDVIDKITRNHKFDLILLDDEAGEYTAYEILKELKKNSNFDTPVIVMIDSNKEFIKLHYLKEGFADVILKEKIHSEIDRILERKY